MAPPPVRARSRGPERWPTAEMMEFGEESPRRTPCRLGASRGLRNDSHHIWDLITSQVAPPCDLSAEGLAPAGQQPLYPDGWRRVGPRRPQSVNDSTAVWLRLIGDMGERHSHHGGAAPTSTLPPPLGSWTFGCPSASDISFGGGASDAWRREWAHYGRRPATAGGADAGAIVRELPHNRSENVRERLSPGPWWRRRHRLAHGTAPEHCLERFEDDGAVPQWETAIDPGRGASAFGSLRRCTSRHRTSSCVAGVPVRLKGRSCRTHARPPSAWDAPVASASASRRTASPFR